MRIILLIVIGLMIGCDKTIREVRSPAPGQPVAAGQVVDLHPPGL